MKRQGGEACVRYRRRRVAPIYCAMFVFGHGSLIWRPGFAHLGAHPAPPRGYHRRFRLRRAQVRIHGICCHRPATGTVWRSGSASVISAQMPSISAAPSRQADRPPTT